MKLFKVLFIGTENGVPSVYQIYERALDGKDAIHRVECKAAERKIKIKEFTKVSLVVSMDLIGEFMKEGL